MNLETAIENLKMMEDRLASGQVFLCAKEFSLYEQSLKIVLDSLPKKKTKKTGKD